MKAPEPGPVPPDAPELTPKGHVDTGDEDGPRAAMGKVESIVSVLLVATPFLLFGLFVLLDRIFS